MRVEVNPSWHDELVAELDPRMDRLVDAIKKDAIREAPRDTGAMASEIISYRFDATTWRVHSLAPYTMWVEYDTKPHEIRFHYWWGMRLWMHPGTTAQPFMRPALYQERSL